MTNSQRSEAADDPGPVAVPRQVHCELKTLGQMGTHDMVSTAVIDGLEAYDFDAALAWVLENPEKYERAVRRGTDDGGGADDA